MEIVNSREMIDSELGVWWRLLGSSSFVGCLSTCLLRDAFGCAGAGLARSSLRLWGILSSRGLTIIVCVAWLSSRGSHILWWILLTTGGTFIIFLRLARSGVLSSVDCLASCLLRWGCLFIDSGFRCTWFSLVSIWLSTVIALIIFAICAFFATFFALSILSSCLTTLFIAALVVSCWICIGFRISLSSSIWSSFTNGWRCLLIGILLVLIFALGVVRGVVRWHYLRILFTKL